MDGLIVGGTREVYLNQFPTGRHIVSGEIIKVNHSTFLVRFSDGTVINRKIKRDLAEV